MNRLKGRAPPVARARRRSHARPPKQELREAFVRLTRLPPGSHVGLDLSGAFALFSEVVLAATDAVAAWKNDEVDHDALALLALLEKPVADIGERRRQFVEVVKSAVAIYRTSGDDARAANHLVDGAGPCHVAFIPGIRPGPKGRPWERCGLDRRFVAEQLVRLHLGKRKLTAERVAAELSVSVGAFGDSPMRVRRKDKDVSGVDRACEAFNKAKKLRTAEE